MKSKIFLLLLIPCSLFAQWEKWQPWVTELGISPYGQVEYRVATPESLGYGVATPESLMSYVNVDKGGTNLKIAMQTSVPPFYVQWGFSNIWNVINMPSRLARDTILSPLYLNCRGGVQIFYEETITYHFSASLIKAIGADELGFTSMMIENVCAVQIPLIIGKLQVLGNIGGGITSEVLPIYDKTIEKESSILNFCLGVFWWTKYAVPYLYTGVTYPIDENTGVTYPIEEEGTNLQYFFSLGVQFVLPRVLLKGIPDISYPQSYSLLREE